MELLKSRSRIFSRRSHIYLVGGNRSRPYEKDEYIFIIEFGRHRTYVLSWTLQQAAKKTIVSVAVSSIIINGVVQHIVKIPTAIISLFTPPPLLLPAVIIISLLGPQMRRENKHIHTRTSVTRNMFCETATQNNKYWFPVNSPCEKPFFLYH